MMEKLFMLSSIGAIFMIASAHPEHSIRRDSDALYSGFKCIFKLGHPRDNLWLHGQFTEAECIEACIERKKIDASINGVVRKHPTPWCWCAKGVKLSDRAGYKFCVLEDTRPTTTASPTTTMSNRACFNRDLEKGVFGKKSYYPNIRREDFDMRECYQKCVEKKYDEAGGELDGASIIDGFCTCYTGMYETGRCPGETCRRCFFNPNALTTTTPSPKKAVRTCKNRLAYGDEEYRLPSEVRDIDSCVEKCLEKREKEDCDINGATIAWEVCFCLTATFEGYLEEDCGTDDCKYCLLESPTMESRCDAQYSKDARNEVFDAYQGRRYWHMS